MRCKRVCIFYRRLIWAFSTVAAPLNSILIGEPKSLKLNQEALKAFDTLKQRLSTSPILQHPHLDLQFTVKVDAYESGVKAIFSQWQDNPAKLDLCALFIRILTAAERNYAMENWESLAIKAALEDWWHWLEGAKFLFIMLTDHKYLEYVKVFRGGFRGTNLISTGKLNWPVGEVLRQHSTRRLSHGGRHSWSFQKGCIKDMGLQRNAIHHAVVDHNSCYIHVIDQLWTCVSLILIQQKADLASAKGSICTLPTIRCCGLCCRKPVSGVASVLESSISADPRLLGCPHIFRLPQISGFFALLLSHRCTGHLWLASCLVCYTV